MKCPNCGHEKFKKLAGALPNNVILVGNVEWGKCTNGGCGKVVIYATA